MSWHQAAKTDQDYMGELMAPFLGPTPGASFGPSHLLPSGSELANAYSDLSKYASVPRCQNCCNLAIIEREVGRIFKRTTRRWACRLGRPDFLTPSVIHYGDAEDMRKFGPCGYDGKLFEKKQEMP